MDALKLLEDIYYETQTLEYGQAAKIDSLRLKTAMVIRNVVGEESDYLNELSIAISYMTYREIFQQGKDKLVNILNTIEDEVTYFYKPEDSSKKIETENQSNKVFIVHGHDEAMKQSVARTIEKMGLTPIILHEQPSVGRTVIEKFTENSDVNFAIVLLSPDDIAYPKEL